MQFELFKNKRLLNIFNLVMFLFFAFIFAYQYYRNSKLIDHKFKIKTIIEKRETDLKGRVTIWSTLKVNGNEYKVSDVVTNYESQNGILILEGDSVWINYEKNDPSNNEFIFLSKKNYPMNR
jgi:hypothetical protein